ncbi:DUF6348 family protein [Anaerotruncus colihominis]|uniref:DUF6348 family protein n=1 Tax=Anaerotruncus colihominis TaxID=169435 RepID=UPI00399131DF
MDQAFFDQLDHWHRQEQFQQIIGAIEAIPAEQRGYELTGLLARAYANTGAAGETDPFEKAVSLLRSTEAEGADDPNWHFRMGYALYYLDREEEAIPHLRRVLNLVPDDPETQAFWADCRELLTACHAAVETREITARYESDPLDVHNTLDYLLRVSLHGCLGCENSVEGDHIWCPDWELTITPQIEQITENSIVLNFYLFAPQWGKELFECSVGMGAGPKQALGMACGSFLFSFMQGVGLMERGEQARELETSFAGNAHRWRVYISDVVGMGDSPNLGAPSYYWDILGEHIAKRLGNQKLCYVKIYGAKSGGDVTGECRIDDIKSEELSALVAGLVEQWDVEGFASHKQFFFLRQEAETTLPDAYLGWDGRERLKHKVKTAAELFHACDNQELYDSLPQRLEEALEDPTLAAECYAFLPEICAENAFDEVTYSETVDIAVGNRPAVTCYKNQLADYWPLHHALFTLFEQGAFGEQANVIYQEYISTSAIYNVISQMKKKGTSLKDAQLTALRYQVGGGFEIR